jgi:hypothetical protein
MNSTAPKPNPDRDLVPITEDFDGPDEVTGVRQAQQVQNTRKATLAHIGYPQRPDRTTSFEKMPMDRLEYELEVQIDQWAHQRMLKTEILGGADPEKQAVIEKVLQSCEAKKKIQGFEVSKDEQSKQVSYTLYYNQFIP